MVATLFGLPPAGAISRCSVTFTPDGGTELWTRSSATPCSAPCNTSAAACCASVWGRSTFVFALAASPEGMALKLEGVRFLGVPLPRLLAPSVATLESERDGRYRFEVEASLPLLGRIVRYAGWLEREV